MTDPCIISKIATIELAVANLGYARGAAIARIHERATELGLTLCPLELGPHLRLQLLDQPEVATRAPAIKTPGAAGLHHGGISSALK